MTVSQTQLALLFANALLLGVGLGFFYDLIRILRILSGERFSTAACRFRDSGLPWIGEKKRRARPPFVQKLLVFWGDFLFCILAAVALILLFYRINNGKVRFLAFPLAGVGFGLYRLSLGRLVMLFAETAAFLLETTARYLVFFVMLPVKWFSRRVVRLTRNCHRRIVQKRQKKARAAYTLAFEAQMEARVEQGMFGKQDEKGVRRDAGRRKQKEAIQPESAGADISGSDRGGIHRRVRQ